MFWPLQDRTEWFLVVIGKFLYIKVCLPSFQNWIYSILDRIIFHTTFNALSILILSAETEFRVRSGFLLLMNRGKVDSFS